MIQKQNDAAVKLRVTEPTEPVTREGKRGRIPGRLRVRGLLGAWTRPSEPSGLNKTAHYTGGSLDLRWFCLNCFASNIAPKKQQSRPLRGHPHALQSLPKAFTSTLPVLALQGTIRKWNNCTLWDFMCQDEENQFVSPEDLSLQDTTINCWLSCGTGVFKGNFYKKKDTNWESNGAHSLRIYMRGRGQLKPRGEFPSVLSFWEVFTEETRPEHTQVPAWCRKTCMCWIH